MIIALGYIALLRLKLPYLFINEDIYEIIVKRFTTTSIRVLTADSPIRARRPNHLSRVWRLRRERGGPVRGHPQRGYETRATGVPQSRPDGGLISRTSGQVREQGERPANRCLRNGRPIFIHFCPVNPGRLRRLLSPTGTLRQRRCSLRRTTCDHRGDFVETSRGDESVEEHR